MLLSPPLVFPGGNCIAMKYGYAAIAILGLSLLPLCTSAQGENTTFNWKFEEASKLVEENLFNQSAEIWKELQEGQPENSNLNWKLGHSYMNSYNQKTKALPYPENGR